MRISIQNQLAFLVVLITLVALAILSVATYFTNYDHFSSLRLSRLTTVAALKAAQLSSNLALLERSVNSLSTRYKIQDALAGYNSGNDTAADWAAASEDLMSALGGREMNILTLQTIVYPRNATGSGSVHGLLNVTAADIQNAILLPSGTGNGTVGFGTVGLGYPPSLYPNLTYSTENNVSTATYAGEVISSANPLLLGPMMVNDTFPLLSFTVPVINNTSATDILGYMTVVVDGTLIYDVNTSPIGLGETGMTLLLAPNTVTNRLPTTIPRGGLEMRFVLPPYNFNDTRTRQNNYQFGDNLAFNGSTYPVVQSGLTTDLGTEDNFGGSLNTRNENGDQVGLGFAIPESNACNWLLVVEYNHSEIWSSVTELRNVILACIFATAAGMALFTWPIAHFAARPIRRLRDATNTALDPPQSDSTYMNSESPGSASSKIDTLQMEKNGGIATTTEKTTLWKRSTSFPWSRKRKAAPVRDTEHAGGFQIPRKVQDRKHLIHDELTDLTSTFNEMVDELTMQYGRLEERVRQRTAELEQSKKVAEAANESKTLFIANISHELKTPLNGILGMCTLALNEDDPAKIKRSLGIIYKSGDLLHHLLTDLLTFSKHQAGKNLSLEEKQFRLGDIGTQLHAIFQKQATDGQIEFNVQFRGPRDAFSALDDRIEGSPGPDQTGKVEDMVLFGDSQRILQVLINLISNSLKFTPAGGKVNLFLTCADRIGDASTTSREPSVTASESKRSHAAAFMQKLNYRMGKRTSIASSNSEDPPEPGAPVFNFEFGVEDSGPGIPEHLQKQIFEPFVQGDLRLTKKFGGTGLGLSICSQLAHLMRGKLGLQSEVGAGSTFTLYIPLKLCKYRRDSIVGSLGNSPGASSPPSRQISRQNSTEHRSASPTKGLDVESNPRLVGLSQPYFSVATPPMASPNNSNSRKDGKLRVLIAEDNSLNAEIVTRMLKLEDVFDVTLAKDGQEALDKVKESMERASPYDLILMDVQMPNIDGLESTRLIRQAGYSAPIVALTAFSDEINQRQCLDSGMDYFLAKPIKRPALKHVLKTYCTTILEGEECEVSQKSSEKSQSERSRSAPSSGASPASNVTEQNPFSASIAEHLSGKHQGDKNPTPSPKSPESPISPNTATVTATKPKSPTD